jgi:hypothetical protein
MSQPPVPRSRKTRGGDDSNVPHAFTIEKYVYNSGAEKTQWRCGEIAQNASTGAWHRCSQHMQKHLCLSHKLKGKHTFDIASDDDPGFPMLTLNNDCLANKRKFRVHTG